MDEKREDSDERGPDPEKLCTWLGLTGVREGVVAAEVGRRVLHPGTAGPDAHHLLLHCEENTPGFPLLSLKSARPPPFVFQAEPV